MSKESMKSVTDSIKATGKTNGYSSAKLHAKEDKKRYEATERQDWYKDLTTEQKIARVKTLAKKYPGESKKQLAKLNTILEVTPAKVSVTTKPATKTVKKVAVKK